MGPLWNSRPAGGADAGEAVLAAVAARRIELVDVIAANDGISVGEVEVKIHGLSDRKHPVATT